MSPSHKQLAASHQASKHVQCCPVSDQPLAMPYQPPHLRNGGIGEAPPADTRGGGSFGGYGRRSDGPMESRSKEYGSSFGSRDVARSNSANRHEAAPTSNGTSTKASSATPQAVFPEWQPSKRALSMSDEQIKEARERLSITVEGETSTSVPLESFDDMVCQSLLLLTVSIVSCCTQCMRL